MNAADKEELLNACRELIEHATNAGAQGNYRDGDTWREISDDVHMDHALDHGEAYATFGQYDDLASCLTRWAMSAVQKQK